MSQAHLGGEHGPLVRPRRVVVVVVEPALPHRDDVGLVEHVRDPVQASGGVVGVDAGGEEQEARVPPGEAGRALGGGQRLADTNDGARAGEARALDDGIPVRVERRVREVGVAVDERRQRTTTASFVLA